MKTLPFLISVLLSLLLALGPEVSESQLLPSGGDDAASILKDFFNYMTKANVAFKSPTEQAEAQKQFTASRQLVKSVNSQKKSYKLKLGKFSHVDPAKVKKMRLGMRRAPNLKAKRLRSAPKFNISRHKGALLKAQKAQKAGRRHKRQDFSSLMALFQQFGGGSLPDLSSLTGGAGGASGLASLFGGAGGGLGNLFGGGLSGLSGGGGLPNPFGGGGIPGIPGFPGLDTGVVTPAPVVNPVGPVNPLGGGGAVGPTTPTQYATPPTVDWRKHNYVRSVKDQGICGSCYTFSSVAAMEGQMTACFGDTTDLSEQNPLACAKSYGAGGCDGGDPGQVFDYAKDHGIASLASMPYINGNSASLLGTCPVVTPYPKAVVASHELLPEGDEAAVQKALSVGPLSACVDAGSTEFQQYSSGVFDGPCTQTVNHAVTIVGYGNDPVGGDYWIVKNSWGTDWGENGYIRIKRNANNLCGIASYVQYPTLANC